MATEQQRIQRRQKRKQKRARKQEFVNQARAGGKCVRCGTTDTNTLEFHHRDPTTKLFVIGGPKKQSSNCSLQRIIDEIAKCDLVCTNCHRVLHQGGTDNVKR
jgi:hypothetical protein